MQASSDFFGLIQIVGTVKKTVLSSGRSIKLKLFIPSHAVLSTLG